MQQTDLILYFDQQTTYKSC